MAKDKLTTKQRLFVEAYLANPNATEAARKAGYKGSDATLANTGAENLRKPYIAKLVEQRIAKAAMTADEVLNELAEIAKAPWDKFFEYQTDGDGGVLKINVKLAEKIKALELVGKYHKLFTDKQEHSGPNGGPQEQKLTIELIEPGE